MNAYDRSVLDHAQALERTAKYFAQLAKTGAVMPLMPEDFEKRITRVFEVLDERAMGVFALVMGFMADAWTPSALFVSWSSYETIRVWSRREEEPRLPTKFLNGKLCVKPSDFFRVFEELGGQPLAKSRVAKPEAVLSA